MKLSKNLGRIATTFLATAMLAAFAAVPASATEQSIIAGSDKNGTIQVEQSAAITKIKFKSQLFLPANVPVPTASYKFTLSPADPTTDGLGKVTETVSGGSSVEIPVLKGEAGIITFDPATVQFSSEDPKVALDQNDVVEGGDLSKVTGIKKVVKDVSIDISSLQFTDAGVYKYTLSEGDITSSEADEFVKGANKTLYLYVERKTGAEVDGTASNYVVTGVVLKNGTTGTDKTAVFNNAYKLNITDPDKPIDPTDPPEATANELMVNNTVKGVMGNKSEKFTYTITITSADSSKKYTAVYETKNGDAWNKGEDVTNVQYMGTTCTITAELAHNEQVHIYGLSNGDNYTVAQTAPTNEGYKTTTPGNANGVYGDEVVTLAFTNEREAIAPTGLVMNVAPYVLLVLVAAGAGYVFLRKREED